MKLFTKIILALILIAFSLYHLGFYIMPSVTIFNNSGDTLTRAQVSLPNNRLDFGEIQTAHTNTLHYSLEQNDGVYSYSFFSRNNITLTGECGYVTKNEINKRVLITVFKSHVQCK